MAQSIRTSAERKQDTLRRLDLDVDSWIATADPPSGLFSVVSRPTGSRVWIVRFAIDTARSIFSRASFRYAEQFICDGDGLTMPVTAAGGPCLGRDTGPCSAS